MAIFDVDGSLPRHPDPAQVNPPCDHSGTVGLMLYLASLNHAEFILRKAADARHAH